MGYPECTIYTVVQMSYFLAQMLVWHLHLIDVSTYSVQLDSYLYEIFGTRIFSSGIIYDRQL